MDETYIKMAYCPQIQVQRPKLEYPISGLPTGIEGVYNFRDWTDKNGNFWCITQTETICLPRQDQLQILSGLSWQEFDKRCIDREYVFSTTKEIAGIQVTMKENHNKVWDGNGWLLLSKM